ncbi:MAG: TolC family protein [Acidobacteria bacterium]|nr:TolC family protein [Acidobacteriota bacterium]
MWAIIITSNLRRRAAWPVLIVILTTAIGAAGQSIFPPRIDLTEATEKALENNPQTRLAETGVKLAEQRIAEVKTARKPFVQFSQTIARSNNPVFVFGSLLEQGRFGASNFAIDKLNHPSGLFNFRSLVSAQKTLYDGGQTRIRTTQAENAKKQADWDVETARQQMRFNVVQTFYGTLLAQEMLKVSDQAVKSAEANCKKTKDMVEVGMTTDADYLAADVELANVLQQKLEVESGLVTTRAALNIALGDRPDFVYDLKGDLTEKFFPVESTDELLRIALETRPEMKRAALAVENSRAQTKAVDNQRLPQVSAFGNFGYSAPYIANGSTDYTVGVSLSYTLFDAGRKSRLEQAATAETMAGLEKDTLADRIRLEVVRAAQSYKTSQARIQVSIKSIAQSEEALRIIQDRYKFGLTTFNEVLRAETAVVRAKHDLLSARYQYYISYAAVLLATGRLTDVRAFE